MAARVSAGIVVQQNIQVSATASLASGVTALVAVDQSTVAAGLADGHVAIWNGKDAAPSLDLVPHKTRVLAVGVSADGRRVLSLASDGSLAETAIAKGGAGRTAKVDLGSAPTRAAVFSPDGTRVIAGGEYGDVRVYDVESGRLRQTFRGHLTEIQDLAVNPRSAAIASASADADIRLWEAATGRQSGIVEGDVSSFAVAFSPRDGTLVSGGVDRRVTFRDPKSSAPSGVFTLAPPKMVATLAWSPDGRWLAVGDIDDETLSKGGLQILEAATRTVVATLATGDAPAERTVFFTNGDRLCGAFRRELRAWNLTLPR